jgi:hypothetical protein
MAAESPISFEARLYRAALLLCPPEFRREHGDEMAADFDDALAELPSTGGTRAWALRSAMGVDLARTIVVQWLRTGLPIIGLVAVSSSLLLIAGLASAVRLLTTRIPVNPDTSEMVGVVLLTVVAVMVIVVTIVFNLCMYRPRRVGRR